MITISTINAVFRKVRGSLVGDSRSTEVVYIISCSSSCHGNLIIFLALSLKLLDINQRKLNADDQINGLETQHMYLNI